MAVLIDKLKNGGIAYLEPASGEPVSVNGIPLRGSLQAINQALYFCAPRVVPEDGAPPKD